MADISGYTKFMVENQLSAVHGQIVITTLIETILREVDIPLQLQGIEGDAVFVYAEHPGNDDAWREVLAEIRTKLLRFFEVFCAGAVTAMESTPCKCAICKNVEHLQLKVIVHSGRVGSNPTRLTFPCRTTASALFRGSLLRRWARKQKVIFAAGDDSAFPCGPRAHSVFGALLLGGRLTSRGSAIRAARYGQELWTASAPLGKIITS